MYKEIKYLVFLLIIFLFLFFVSKYYFSDKNIKKSYRQLNNIDSRNSIYAEKLPILDDDTQNIIEYVDQSKKKKKKFNFWNLLEKDE
ncbi:MAG: hypothetical protein CNC05_03550 [Pelagibacterales bacterium MED-G42]|jgi:hypothetical protein|nr:MAG: hypothetical protein CNC05_03550 [Pelagibacterales bacterium MED-G42]|tara:strand:- start:3593 stop:3853 length:261 start_codon:yes stop_codon:yes gene_type:complete